ncbi:uncharacterized protein MELLADRAFT_107258 [Melampsora larici-populina 98AG31]|uniref:Secreted protein n=1 Tax=Melampsora larici-populina (strain 98AG31 / pathotype 3-4-7) TaxID=747676 RepID=F4RPC8_MELLP|nr:uncharacterized protein MELLADRAFT_107258 [Melampsora larici-populina 98AG31]EGG05871.1 hypothetical protein MELLADRAFT_107258 [Melampsora larici-populina 98AG31]
MTNSPLPFLLLIFILTIRMHTSALIINTSEKPILKITSSDQFYSNPIEESSQSTEPHLDLISGLVPKQNQKALQRVFISNFLGISNRRLPVWIYHSPISSRKYNHQNNQNNANLPHKFSNVLQKRDNSQDDPTETPNTLDENVVAKDETTVPDQQEATQDTNLILTSGQSDAPAQDLSQDSEIASSADSLSEGQDSALPVDMDATFAGSSISAVDPSEEYYESWEIQTSSSPEIPSSTSKDSTTSESDSSETLAPESDAVMNTFPHNLASETVVETASQTLETFENDPSDTSTTPQSPTFEVNFFIAKEPTNLSPESGVVIEQYPNTGKDTSGVSKSGANPTRTKLGNLTPAASSGAIENDSKKTGLPCKSCGNLEDVDNLPGGTLKGSKSTKMPSKSKEATPRISSGEIPSVSSGEIPSISSGDTPSISSGNTPSISSGNTPPISSGNTPSITSDDTTFYSGDIPMGGSGYLTPQKKPSKTSGPEEKSGSKDVKLSPEDNNSGQTIRKENDPNKSKEEKDKKERQSSALSIGIFSGLAGGLACTIFLAMII